VWVVPHLEASPLTEFLGAGRQAGGGSRGCQRQGGEHEEALWLSRKSSI
jgi:hypothetical protein